MSIPNTLPYDICSLNLEYVISKNKEIALTSNMLIIAFMFILYCVYSNYSHRVRTMLFTLNKYIELVERINNDQNIFDFSEPSQNIFNPVALLEHYNSIEGVSDEESDGSEDGSEDGTQSEAASEGGEDDTPEPQHKPYRLRNRKPVEYRFDRDYTVPLVRNRKTKSTSNLGISGKTWRLD